MTGKSPLSATEDQRAALAGLAGSRERGDADRARAGLLTLAGWTSTRIAEALGVREDTVRLWRGDFMRGGVAALAATRAAPAMSKALRKKVSLATSAAHAEVQRLEQQAKAGDDESEALTLPILPEPGQSWERMCVCRAPGQAKKIAHVIRRLIVHTSLTKRSSDFVAISVVAALRAQLGPRRITRALGANPSFEQQARPKKAGLRRRRIDAHRHLPQAERRHRHRDLGDDHFDRRRTEVKAKRLVGQLAKLGFEVELRLLAQAA